MPFNEIPADDLPEIQVLMAAVIRLMAKCADEYDVAPARTLLRLIKELRAHPDLSRRPAVLAGLAEAHAVWLERMNKIADMQGNCAASDIADDRGYKIH